MGDFADLLVYKKSFELAMAIFEITKTKGWLRFAFECRYFPQEQFNKLTYQCDEVGKLLNHMMNNPEKYGSV